MKIKLNGERILVVTFAERQRCEDAENSQSDDEYHLRPPHLCFSWQERATVLFFRSYWVWVLTTVRGWRSSYREGGKASSVTDA